jgi:hypothetical protein
MFDVMGVEGIPEKLFQYTSVDSLEKILSNCTIRFSRLDTVNDPEEAKAADVPNAASSVMVSCWSADERESIPMWSMYGDHFSGVRFGMPSNMFLGRQSAMIWENGGATTSLDTFFHVPREAPAMTTNSSVLIGPNKIYYSDDDTFRNRNLIVREPEYGEARFLPYDLGMVKSTD